MANGQLETVCGQSDALTAAAAGSELSDRTLLKRFVAARDEAAFAAIVERHTPA